MEDETNPRIKELQARLEADPGSRVFYQLGEELRKARRSEEAESVLRAGLEKHPSYLSALISLGRVLKESDRSTEAIEVLTSALELDRQNVVVARLLAECYAEIGEDVEAIKKYKLVAALHPADEAIQERIEEIEGRLRSAGTLEAPPPEPGPAEEVPASFREDDGGSEGPAGEEEPFGASTSGMSVAEEHTEPAEAPLFDDADAFDRDGSGDLPMESGSGEPAPGSDREADMSGWGDDPAEEEPSPETQSSPPRLEESGDGHDVVATVTMGDLYARQGHVEQAREIYRKVLDRDPSSEAGERLDSLEAGETLEDVPLEESGSSNQAKVARLEQWLSRINR